MSTLKVAFQKPTNKICTPVEIRTLKVTGKPTKFAKGTALWDTGATRTAINQKVASGLGLKPVDKTVARTANGDLTTYVYVVDVLLPGGIKIPNLSVSGAPLGDLAALIGMDIIGSGDMMIVNDGKTTFEFRIPSSGCAPFSAQNTP